MRPADTVNYGKQLLGIADEGASGRLVPAFPEKKREWVGGDKPVLESTITVDEQTDILRAAGWWYVYWSE